MKKLMVLLMVLMPSVCLGFTVDGVEDITQITATGAGASSPGYLYGIIIATDGTNTVTLEGVDGTAGSTIKTIIPKGTVVTTGSQNRQSSYNFSTFPITCAEGVYYTASSSGAYTITTLYRNAR